MCPRFKQHRFVIISTVSYACASFTNSQFMFGFNPFPHFAVVFYVGSKMVPQLCLDAHTSI